MFQKLRCPFCKTSMSQNALSYIGPTIWSKIPDTLEQANNLDTLKHNLTRHYLKELKISNPFLLYFESCSILSLQDKIYIFFPLI